MTPIKPCPSCKELTELVRITPIVNADHDSRVYHIKACGNFHTALVLLA